MEYFILFIVLMIIAGILDSQLKKKKINEREIALENSINKIENFEVSKKIFINQKKYLVAIDDINEKIIIFNQNSKKEIHFKDILKFESIEDGVIVNEKSSIRMLGGGLIGGVLAGGVGAILGGLSGKSRSIKEISKIELRIVIRDITSPSEIIVCFNAIDFGQVKVKIDNPVILEAKKETQILEDLLSIIIDKIDKKDKALKGIENEKLSIADELLKLNNLKNAGILTENEFEVQKNKLLNSN